jgi:peroxiredoxin
MRWKIIVSLMCVGAFLLASASQSLTPGDTAPEFLISSIDGKRTSLKDLRGEGVVFLYFIRDGDPVNNEAMNMLHRMIRAYYPNDHAKFFGVINADQNRARSWNAEMDPPYKLLLDPKLELVYKYKVESSPAIVEIDTQGRIVKEWQGFSGYWLKDLNGFLAKATRKPLRQFDFSKTPSVTQFGRPYRER